MRLILTHTDDYPARDGLFAAMPILEAAKTAAGAKRLDHSCLR